MTPLLEQLGSQIGGINLVVDDQDPSRRHEVTNTRLSQFSDQGATLSAIEERRRTNLLRIRCIANEPEPLINSHLWNPIYFQKRICAPTV